MVRTKIQMGIERPNNLFKPILIMVLTLLLISLVVGCEGPAATTQLPTSSATPTTTSSGPAVPTGELVAALVNFGNENFLPWKADLGSSQITTIIYDVLIYWDEVNRKYIPGLAESWETSPDALTLTYHLRKGVQFSDGWGEFTSADVQYTFEKHGARDSIGQIQPARNIASMESPDPYTLVVHFKRPAPIFYSTFSIGNSGNTQGIVCKKYVETVGDTVASQKPVGSGPYKLVESQLGSYYKFEAVENHWRVVPEFKTLTLRAVPEISTTVAMLKTKEIDLANVPAEQLADLKSSGLATELSPVGGFVIDTVWGGLCLPDDDRYDPAYHNKDPWVDMRVRKAMTISIDRQAICDAIFAGAATPAGVILYSTNMDKYQYPYDPAAAKQLLVEAGYPNGFSFDMYSFTQPGVPETPRVVEALVGYWQQIGLNPKIVVSDYASYNLSNRLVLRMAGQISVYKMPPSADMLDRVPLFLMPNGPIIIFQDEGSYAIWKEGNTKVNADERNAVVDQLNKYYFENYGSIPLVNTTYCFAWNSAKISPFPHSAGNNPYYLEYARHAQPLKTFRLFTPWPDR